MNARTTTILTWAALGAAAAGSCLLPRELSPSAASAFSPAPLAETLILPTTIRDFRKTHGDFNVTLAGGNGHYAGNVGLTLPISERPSYTSAGYRVSTQWRDKDTNPIAPHMYINMADGRKVHLVNAPTINNNPTIDTYDSTIGAYGPSNKGPAPTWVPGSTMPNVVLPTGLPPLVNEVQYDGNTTSTLDADIHCNKFLARNNYRLRISGERIIVAREEFRIENFAKIELLPGARLSIYALKDAVIQNNIDFNLNTVDPSRLIIYYMGTGNFIIENSAATYARIIAPNGGLHIKNSGELYGNVTAKNITLDNQARLHIDTQGYGRVCGVLANDSMGSKGANSAAGVSSAATYSQWFADTMGVNLSTGHDLVLTKDGTGAWQYSNNAFFPIDGRLFGNESMAHNYFFTLHASATFTHHSCSGRFFEFTGADDFWLFIDGKLVLDIGGVMPMQKQRIDVDRLNLVAGQTYRLDIFYAQRNPSVSAFHMRTNLDLIPPATGYTVSAGHD